MTTDGVLISRDMLAFLCGDGPLEGYYFGEKPEHERGNFWWRKHLREAEKVALEQAGEPSTVKECLTTAAYAGVTQGDIDHLDGLLDCAGDCEKMLAAISAHRLQSVAAATAAKDAEVARLREALAAVQPVACGDWCRDDKHIPECEKARAALSESREAGPDELTCILTLGPSLSIGSDLSEAREAGDSLAAGDRV
ncbi:hypothetical protein N6H05_14595 [Sphingobium sp. WTD-1]|uniref:hypothetical protein n=1 Tax=Sphingobium sp. WTD-1 TaxID=2979467 RepID=UPI0024DEA721|nr:hypothetical protein [Sphingobium sp. WTD-1]WIA54292.1 hypothetical protein N6H05_14595 [Sphingobium sp. WTD-1]